MSAFSANMTADDWLKAHRDHLSDQLREATQQASYWAKRRDELVAQMVDANRLVDQR